MKVLKVIVAATMLFAAQKASAIGDVSVFGGYTTVNMTTVNAALDLFNLSGLMSATKFGGGYYVGVDAGFSVMPFLKVGPRIELLSAGQAKLTDTNGLFMGPAGAYFALDGSMILYEAGVSGSWELPVAGLSVGGGVWLGYGMANVSTSFNDTATTNTQGYGGSGFVSEIQGQVAYKIIPTISVGMDLGYRIASISQVTASADGTNGSSVKSGDVLKDFVTGLVPQDFDFSGINVGARVSFGF
jgi:hypothetical protein